MTRLLIAVAAVAMLAVPAASFAAAAKKPAKTEAKKEDPKKAEPAKDAKPADAKPATADAGTPAPDAGKPAEKAEATELQKIPKLGLRFQGTIKMAQQDMNGQVMVSNDAGLAFTVGPTNDYAVKTFDEAKLAKNDYSPTNVQKEVKLEDGWNIQFQNKGAMGDNYFVWIRRTFGGKAYQCEATATTAEQAAKVEKMCLSLAKQ
ncbi:MAG TPA: hypothetical protein VGK67_19980 [Myxococcales bacterium]|jgi:Ni/Co efflux regulator RcnB